MTTAVYREKLRMFRLLSSKEVVSCSLRHERAKLRPFLSATAEVLELAPYQTVTGTNEHFVVGRDSRQRSSSPFCQRLFCTAEIVFADDTFRAVPRIFQQLFTVNCIYNEKLLPAV